jgi:hypothetical protein
MVLETLNTLGASKVQSGTLAYKSIYRAQNSQLGSKLTMQFLAPIVALSGDACPLWAWQGFRSLGEADHTLEIAETSLEQLY